jgi:hypothetical protein
MQLLVSKQHQMQQQMVQLQGPLLEAGSTKKGHAKQLRQQNLQAASGGCGAVAGR